MWRSTFQSDDVEKGMFIVNNLLNFFYFNSLYISLSQVYTEHPREDNPDLYHWAEITGQHTNI